MTEDGRPVYRIGGAGVIWREAGDEVVILDTASAVYFGLDRSGARLWRSLVHGATAAELVAILAGDTTADPERVAADVAAFLDSLHGYGLIRPA